MEEENKNIKNTNEEQKVYANKTEEILDHIWDCVSVIKNLMVVYTILMGIMLLLLLGAFTR